jgi:hypothetical protein
MMQKIEIDLEYMPYIAGPPSTPKQLHQQACSNDDPTIQKWKDIWVENTKKNHEFKGPFKDSSIGSLFQKWLGRPAIVCGSGPSLVKNGLELKNKGPFGIVSCLHNFHYMEDNDIDVDYFVTLDAGDITLDEISEGGKLTHEEYLERTEKHTLLAFVGCSHKLVQAWRGKIIWFHCPIPSDEVNDRIDEIEKFRLPISTGGNVLGAAFYIARAVLGSHPIVFCGADFSFSYGKKFHGWKSSYDTAGVGQGFRHTDVYGIKVHTWPSYYNFKCWFESKVCMCPGIYINATEGGIFGSYNEGNIQQVRQMTLKQAIRMFTMSDELTTTMTSDPSGDGQRSLLF